MYLYVITNLINNKKYVGITNNPKKRWDAHKKAQDKDMVIAKAIKKYGSENFTFEVLLDNIPEEEIDAYEQEYIKKLETHVSTGKGYNVSWGGKYHFNVPPKYGCDNNNAHLTEDEVRFIKSHRDQPIYVLYEDFKDKLTYNAFKKVYWNKTYKNIEPTVDPYPYNSEFSNQFSSGNKLTYEQVVKLRKQYVAKIPWREVYENEYKELYPDELTFWNIYYGNRYKLVMPEVFTDENRHFQSSIMHSGENNGRAKLTKEEVIQMRYDFEHGIKTRKEIQQEHPNVTTTSINDVLRYKTWKNI